MLEPIYIFKIKISLGFNFQDSLFLPHSEEKYLTVTHSPFRKVAGRKGPFCFDDLQRL